MREGRREPNIIFSLHRHVIQLFLLIIASLSSPLSLPFFHIFLLYTLLLLSISSSFPFFYLYIYTVSLEKNALSKECELFEENCTRIHNKEQVCN